MIVVDASVVVRGVTDPGPVGALVQRRMDQEEVVAPELLDLEVLSALRGMVLGGRLSDSQGRRGLAVLGASPIERVPITPLLPRIWELRDNVSPYDAAYVALAETSGCSLVSLDARLARAPGIRCAVELIS